jgi:hypothetical protein
MSALVEVDFHQLERHFQVLQRHPACQTRRSITNSVQLHRSIQLNNEEIVEFQLKPSQFKVLSRSKPVFVHPRIPFVYDSNCNEMMKKFDKKYAKGIQEVN